MGFLPRLFGKTQDPLLDRAGNLVQAAHINAIGMLTPLLERFPILERVDIEQWDFVLTVAGVFMATSRLNNLKLGDSHEERLMEIVADSLTRWKPDGICAFEDCKGLFEEEYDRLTAVRHEPLFVSADAVGIWIVWNVLGRSPQSDEECQLVRAAGTLTTHAFFDWWDA